MSTPDLVLALHGTRSAAGQQVATELIVAVAGALPGVTVHLGWADVLSPTLTQTLSALADPVVVPGFLTAGYHVTSDLPAAIQAAGGRGRLTDLIGPALVAAVADRLTAAGPLPDAVVLGAAGSKRRRSLAEVGAAAGELAALLGRPVVPGFVTSASPTVGEAVASLRAAGHRRVGVATYLLAPGVFADRLHQVGADVVSDPIGVHPLVVAAVVSAYSGVVDHELDLLGARVPGSGVERIA